MRRFQMIVGWQFEGAMHMALRLEGAAFDLQDTNGVEY